MKIRSILPIQYSLSLKAKYPPFNQDSIWISPDTKSHSCVHNSVTAPLLRQMNPCHILLLHFFFFWFITVLFWSHKISCLNSHAKDFWQEVRMCTSTTVYVSQVLRISATLDLNLIIGECTYYDVLLYVIFSSFPLYPQIYGQIFSPAKQTSVTPLLWRSTSRKSAPKVALEIFSHTQLYTGWFMNFGHYFRIKVTFSVVMVPYFFNSSEHITVSGPSDLMEFPIKCFKIRSLWIKGSFC